MKTCRVGDIFSVEYGNGLELVSLEKDFSGYNFVARGKKNNGVSAIVKPVIGERLFPEGSITVAVSGSVMESFLQPAPFYTAYHVMVLMPHSPMTDAVKLFYCHCLRMNKFKYSYGRQANETLADLQVPNLDAIPQDVTDFSISDYAATMRTAINYEALEKRGVCDGINVEMKPLGKLFQVVNGIAATDIERQKVRPNANWVPFVRPSYRQSTSVDAYVNRYAVPGEKLFPKETLYVSTNGQGSHTYAYVSASEFVPNSDVSVLLPKRAMCMREKLAYSLLISYNRFRFSYGRKPKGDKLKSIMLPTAIPEEWNMADLESEASKLVV